VARDDSRSTEELLAATAAELRCSEAVVRQRVSRGLVALRRRLTEERGGA
jgi:DNA-directed RNA polymerase specialized sigma24 family protein